MCLSLQCVPFVYVFLDGNSPQFMKCVLNVIRRRMAMHGLEEPHRMIVNQYVPNLREACVSIWPGCTLFSSLIAVAQVFTL